VLFVGSNTERLGSDTQAGLRTRKACSAAVLGFLTGAHLLETHNGLDTVLAEHLVQSGLTCGLGGPRLTWFPISSPLL
jgi:hypothetical protein